MQCGNSARYRGHASFLQGNGGSRTYSLPGSSAKHHRSVSKDFAGYMQLRGDGWGAVICCGFGRRGSEGEGVRERKER